MARTGRTGQTTTRMLRRSIGACATLVALGIVAAGSWAAGGAIARRTGAAKAGNTTTRPSHVAASQPAGAFLSAPQSQPAFEAWYREQLRQVKPTDTNQLCKLALACLTSKHPAEAAEVCRRVLAAWPEHARAKELLRASNRLQLATRPAVPSPGSLTTSSRPAAEPAAFRKPAGTTSILTAVAMSRLRFAEFNFNDMSDRPHVVIPPAVSQEFLAEMDKTGAMSQQEKLQFLRSSNDDKLRWIMLHTGDRFSDRIQVMSEPHSLSAYRQKVWPIISKSCALAACHGGEQAGHLHLVSPTNLPAVGATNFYILSTFEGNDGRMIDRLHPEASLLLQYGLPAEQAEFKHPAASRPLYTGTNDKRYQIVLEWIRSLRSPTPEYGLTPQMWQPLGQVAEALPGVSPHGGTAGRAPASQPKGTRPAGPAAGR